MRVPPILRLFRPAGLLASVGICLAFAYGVGVCLHWLRYWLRLPIPVGDLLPIVAWTLAFVAGLTLVLALRSIQDRPLSWVLPGSRRRFTLWHSVAALLVALAVTGATAIPVPFPRIDLPFANRFGMVLVAQSLNAPLSRRPGRAAISGWMVLACLAAFVAGGVAAPEIVRWAATHGGLALVLGLAAACVNLAAWHGRERTRFHAVAKLPMAFAGGRRIATHEFKVRAGGRWMSSAQARRGQLEESTRQMAKLCLYIPPAIFVISWLFGAIMGPSVGFDIGGATIIVALIIGMQGDNILLPKSCRDPISRRDRLRNSRLMLWTMLLGLPVLAVLLTLADQCGWRLVRSGPFHLDFNLVRLAAATVFFGLPAGIWLKLVSRRWFRGSSYRNLLIAILPMVGFILFERLFLWLPLHSHLTAWLTFAALLSPGFYFLCEANLRNHFLREDLVGDSD
jgi:hypothetical protein